MKKQYYKSNYKLWLFYKIKLLKSLLFTLKKKNSLLDLELYTEAWNWTEAKKEHQGLDQGNRGNGLGAPSKLPIEEWCMLTFRKC